MLPCWANQKPRSVPPTVMPESIGRSRMPKPNEQIAQMMRLTMMMRRLAFQ